MGSMRAARTAGIDAANAGRNDAEEARGVRPGVEDARLPPEGGSHESRLFYSVARAMTGSIFVTRRAGRKLATRLAEASATRTVTNTTGSRGLT